MTRVLAVVAVVAALGGLFLFGLLRGRPDRDIASNLVGKPAPAFELPLYERYQAEWGPSFESARVAGRPMVVNFWASWCGPCYQEAPALQRAWREFGDEVVFVGVQTQDRDNRADGLAFLERFDLGFPNVIDDASALSVEYGVFGVPETFFVRADGTVAYRHTGPVDADVLEREINALRGRS